MDLADCPVTVKHWYDDRGRVWPVEIQWGLVNDRYEPVKVCFMSAGRALPVTHELVKKIPLGSIVRLARREQADLVYVGEKLLDDAGVSQRLNNEALRFGSHRGVASSPGDLQQVADVYRSARIEGRPVTRAVADALRISSSTAGKRIMAARRAGLLEGVGIHDDRQH